MSGAHARELAFLEVGIHPQPVRRHQRDELRADRGVGAGARAAVADRAVDRRAQFGVAQVELRGIAVGNRAGQRRFGLLLLRVDDVELPLRRLQRRACPGIGGERLLIVGIRLLEPLQRCRTDPVPGCDSDRRRISCGRSRRGRGQLGLRLGDHRFLQPAGRLEIRQRGLLPGHGRNRLRQRRAVVAVVQLHQQVARVHCLVSE